MDKLKPCPFCGGEAAFLGETCTIKCKQCGGAFIVTNPGMTRLELKETWNRRVNDAPGVHEKWLLDRWPSWPHRECSRCKIMIPRTKEVADQYWQYCPNCGARMDGGNEGE